MIVKNGASTLARCLESVRGIVDEIVVADTGSTDRSPEIALQYGTHVVHIPWEDDFSKARNLALQHGHADWVLYLDADEMLDAEARQKIPSLLARADVMGYDVWRWNYVRTITTREWDRPAQPNPHRIEAARDFPAYVEDQNIRLFRRHPDIFFEGKVHEGVADRIKRLGLKVADGGFLIHHLGIAEDTPEVRKAKNDFYLKLGLDKLREDPDDPRACFEVGMAELEHRSNPDAALGYFQHTIELLPTSGPAWTFRGLCLVRLGKVREGLEALRHAEKLGARTAVLYEAMADAFYNLENFEEARRCYRKARQHGSQSTVVESKLGVCEVRLGNADPGLRLIQEAIAREPEFPELYDILLAAALFAGNRKLAAEAADHRIALPGAAPDHLLIAAGVRAQLGEWQRVVEIVISGCRQFPEDPKLRAALAELQQKFALHQEQS